MQPLMQPLESTTLPHWDRNESRAEELTQLGDRVCAATSAALLLVFVGSLAGRWLGI